VARPITLRIALPLDSSFFREVVRGVAAYSAAKSNWQLVFDRSKSPHLARAAKRSNRLAPQAALVAVSEPRAANEFARARVPCLNLGSAGDSSRLPEVGNDDHAIGASAAAHLLELGARSYLCVGLAGAAFSRGREQGFLAALRSAGRRGKVVRSEQPRELTRALRDAEKPCAVFAVNDSVALQVCTRCAEERCAVPRDIAVIGADNDDLVRSLAQPPLSSVVTSSHEIGYRAAELLDAWLGGERPPRQTLLAPRGVEVRGSTRTAIDRSTARALRYMRDHLNQRVTIERVATFAHVSRSTLQRRFVELFGHGPLRELHSLRVASARDLLASGNLSVKEIASRVGLTPSELVRLFRALTGRPPSAFRGR
jgi:LacI family transcriptional regulator